MNRLVVFGVLTIGLLGGAVVSVGIGGNEGEEPEQALKGCFIGLGMAGAGLLAYSRLKKSRDQAALPAS